MESESGTKRTRLVLKTGALVFGISALWLLVSPGLFLQLLGLEQYSSLHWSMRMIGITLVALSGNMYSTGRFGSLASVKFTGRVMFLSAGALGVITLLIPARHSWFTIAYAVVGFTFAAAYLWAMRSK